MIYKEKDFTKNRDLRNALIILDMQTKLLLNITEWQVDASNAIVNLTQRVTAIEEQLADTDTEKNCSEAEGHRLEEVCLEDINDIWAFIFGPHKHKKGA